MNKWYLVPLVNLPQPFCSSPIKPWPSNLSYTFFGIAAVRVFHKREDRWKGDSFQVGFLYWDLSQSMLSFLLSSLSSTLWCSSIPGMQLALGLSFSSTSPYTLPKLPDLSSGDMSVSLDFEGSGKTASGYSQTFCFLCTARSFLWTVWSFVL